MFFKRNAVRTAVLDRVESRIKDAEERFTNGIKEINDETSEAVNALIEASNDRKENLLEACVDTVIN